MKSNVSGTDRSIRILVGITAITAGIYYQSYWVALGLVPLVTGIIGWCPAYRLLGLSTCSVKSNDG